MNKNNPPFFHIFDHFLVDIKKQVPPGSSLVVGFSGGPDSVFLLLALSQLKQEGSIKQLIAAHLDHEWRPDSHNDVQFCQQLCTTLAIPFESAKLSEFSTSFKWDGSQEEFGRNARQSFFEAVKNKYHADLIALGHHQDDQIETFFIRLLRGASLTGLCGMKSREGDIIRPLLHLKKETIVNYLQEHGIPFLQDPTNVSEDYLRNRIRAQVIPALEAVDNRFSKTVPATLARLQETEQYLQLQTQVLFASLSKQIAHHCALDIDQLLSQHPVMLKRLLLHWLCVEQVPFTPSDAFFEEIIRFLRNKVSPHHTLHPTWSINKKDGMAWISKHSTI